MSWQRIDENTYIDDTLVTCVEYQLFIDEMREQGKYYQPDHWTSYQFLAGHAHEPILGIRHFDAVKFCSWLTERNNWKNRFFRLPTQEEASGFPSKLLVHFPIGTWILDDVGFSWISSVPKDGRGLDVDVALNRDSNLAFGIALSYGRNLSEYLDHSLDPRHSLALINMGAQARARNLSLVNFFKRARLRAVTINKDFKRRVRDIGFVFECINGLFHNYNRACDRANALALELDRLRIGSLALALTRDFDLDTALDVYILICDLQERIAGRSPAFEGIRLVKERIR